MGDMDSVSDAYAAARKLLLCAGRYEGVPPGLERTKRGRGATGFMRREQSRDVAMLLADEMGAQLIEMRRPGYFRPGRFSGQGRRGMAKKHLPDPPAYPTKLWMPGHGAAVNVSVNIGSIALVSVFRASYANYSPFH